MKDFMKNKQPNNKTCRACQGNASPLTQTEIIQGLEKLGSKWQLNKTGHLYKEYKFKDFTEPMNFANKIAKLAEELQHHPNLTIAWGKLGVEIWTHKINGLSEIDFILASKIELIE